MTPRILVPPTSIPRCRSVTSETLQSAALVPQQRTNATENIEIGTCDADLDRATGTQGGVDDLVNNVVVVRHADTVNGTVRTFAGQ